MHLPIEGAQARVEMEDGASILIRRHGRVEAPRLILSHGNGLAIDGYFPFWAHLLDHYDVVVFDFRNHGRNPIHHGRVENWPQFIRDFDRVLNAIDDLWGRKRSVGLFHSMSAVTALLHAARHDTAWAALILFEPPMLPPEGHPLRAEHLKLEDELTDRTLRRRDRFASVDDLVRSFAQSPAFSRLSTEALYGLASATLRADGSTGGYRLACPKDFEAETFRIRAIDGTWPLLKQIALPIRIVSSDPHCAAQPILAHISQAMSKDFGFDYVAIPDSTHLLQIERPDACVAAVDQYLTDTLGWCRA